MGRYLLYFRICSDCVEYQAQRYEGASTLFGPHTLAGYQQEYAKLAKALATGTSADPGPTPPDLSGNTVRIMRGSLLTVEVQLPS